MLLSLWHLTNRGRERFDRASSFLASLSGQCPDCAQHISPASLPPKAHQPSVYPLPHSSLPFLAPSWTNRLYPSPRLWVFGDSGVGPREEELNGNVPKSQQVPGTCLGASADPKPQ